MSCQRIYQQCFLAPRGARAYLLSSLSALQVQIRALLNDTVGTLACGRYSSPDVTMGIILGTGTNCCYVEKTDNIKKLQEEQKAHSQESMVINMEWGSYISELLPMTADDYASDAAGANPGKCFFEKLISGMFMGESVRLTVTCIAHFLRVCVNRFGLFSRLLENRLMGGCSDKAFAHTW